ncbi:hypothetical protein EXW72_27875 [Pseudomonas sp. BCA14]|nr:hypothetical protein EXW70_26080 [Pseudomonas sp. JMN1]TFF03790.1 hypothetical protein EXW71_28150 [Pseudomonas sp. BCA17]TFF18183.1 hypothetical protein EXW72_27875 [Pseudomonas sp. BCA14]
MGLGRDDAWSGAGMGCRRSGASVILGSRQCQSVKRKAPSVGVGLPAKNVNDNACCLNEHGACGFFASKWLFSAI